MAIITIREWLRKYENGDFTPSKYATQQEMLEKACSAGWYDWFCNTQSRNKRMEKQFVGLLKKITNDYILDNYYIWFKNNCPCAAPLYDDIRFEPINQSLREKKYFLVVANDKRKECRWNIWTFKHETYILSTDAKKDIVNWINSEAEEL